MPRPPERDERTPEAFFAGLDVAGAPRSLVALGGQLDVPTLIAAYRHACFPWPAGGRGERSLERSARRLARQGQVPLLPLTPEGVLVPWCSTEPRAVLLADHVTVSRSLRKTLRRSGWTTTVDAAFEEVVAACADRDTTWITAAMQDAYASLHRAGVAHSVEVWDGPALVGGLYGVLIGRLFSGESMFHRTSDASKVALVDLCYRLLEVGAPLVDVQQETELLTSLGAVLVARTEYVGVVRRLRDSPVRLPADRRPVAQLGTAGLTQG